MRPSEHPEGPRFQAAAARHDFDTVGLPSDPTVVARAPGPDEIMPLFAAASFSLGLRLADPTIINKIYAHDPASLWLVERDARVIGGAALLFLSQPGLERLQSGELDLRHPDVCCLVAADAPPAGIYIWALYSRARAFAGIGRIIEVLRRPRFRGADLWAVAHTDAGARLMQSFGFHPYPATRPGLQRYARRPDAVDARPL